MLSKNTFALKAVRAMAITLALWTGIAGAEISSDHHVQSDRLISLDLAAANPYGVGGLVATGHLDYIKSMLKEGYPLRSIVLHATSQGISVSDTAYLLTLAQPQRAAEIYSVVIHLMKDMPGWVCGEHLDPDIRYPIFYEPSRLGANPRVGDIAFSFFERAEMAGFRNPATGEWSFPDLSKKQYLIRASVEELIALKNEELARFGSNGWWYQVGGGNDLPGTNGMPVLVSLYKFDRAIAIDASLGQLQQMRGLGTVPVAVVYNESLALPISRSCKIPEDSNEPAHAQPQDITIDRVIKNYFDCGRRLTPPREWHTGDYHLMVPTSRIAAIFGFPRWEDVPQQRLDELKADVQTNGFIAPVLVTVNRDSHLAWASDRDRVAVAEGLGIEAVPVVFFFHDIARESCAATPLCKEQVCRAVVAAGTGFSPRDCKETEEPRLGYGAVSEGTGDGASQSAAGSTRSDSAESQQVREILNQAAEQAK